MAASPKITTEDLTVVVPIFVAIALLMAVLRLADRIRGRRYGWDDTFAALCMISMIMATSFCFIYLTPSTTGQLGVISYYGAATSFLAVMWTARISILFSITRIVVYQRHKHWLYAQVALFMLFFFLLVAENFWLCERQPAWKELVRPQCPLGMPVSLSQLLCDVLADCIIIVVPVYIFATSTLERSIRLRFILLFSSSMFITVFSIAHDIIMWTTGGLGEEFVAMIEAAVALIVCNLTVIVTTCIRLWSRHRRDMDIDAQGSVLAAASSLDPRSFDLMASGGKISGSPRSPGAQPAYWGRRPMQSQDVAFESEEGADDISLGAMKSPKEDLSEADGGSFLDLKDITERRPDDPFGGSNWRYARPSHVVTSPQDGGVWLRREVVVIDDSELAHAV